MCGTKLLPTRPPPMWRVAKKRNNSIYWIQNENTLTTRKIHLPTLNKSKHVSEKKYSLNPRVEFGCFSRIYPNFKHASGTHASCIVVYIQLKITFQFSYVDTFKDCTIANNMFCRGGDLSKSSFGTC